MFWHLQAGMTEDWYLPLSEQAESGDVVQVEGNIKADALNAAFANSEKSEEESELEMNGGEVDAFFEAINS